MPEPQTDAANIRSPKRDKESSRGRAGWYEYYAGFSPSFVQDALALSAAKPGEALILDPWNGSGTTTDVSLRKGFDATGFDLNPVMVIVAKARTLQGDIKKSIASLFEEIFLRASATAQDFEDDPLTEWLSVETASHIRRIEIALQMILVDANKYQALGIVPTLENVSSLAAFFYVALFRLLKQILKPFRSSNPTWIKGADSTNHRVHLPPNHITSLLRTQVSRMAEDLGEQSLCVPTERTPRARLDIASSLSIPVDSNSAQIVITSPPYCTRIDYVVKTAPELALLGMADTLAIRQLRELMIGTPTIAKEIAEPLKSWGKTCLNLLHRVARHNSRASKTYYLRTQTQYFDGLYKSLLEINRALAAHGECFLVVQDSYYKELRIDVAQIVKEMAISIGWECSSRRDFASSRTIVGVNRGARVYNNPPKVAIESVLHFTKSALET